MKKTIGIFAHVDAGKTTLSELLLYKTNAIRTAGRVDSGNTTLDCDETERQRGITIFSDTAKFTYNNNKYYLVDTPGHTDFSPEAERALKIIDYAVLVISAVDGVQAHTKTLFRLLRQCGKPIFFFINKCDIDSADKENALQSLNASFSDCLDFSIDCSQDIALYSDALFEKYSGEDLRFDEETKRLIAHGVFFPCFCGSALRDEGVDFFLESFDALTFTAYDENAPFSAQIFKIRHSADGNRICFLKILSGKLGAKDKFTIGDSTEKINEIRFYKGARFTSAAAAYAGDLCAVSGLTIVSAGDYLGTGGESVSFELSPALMCSVIYEEKISSREILRIFRILEDEEPTLCVSWNEEICDVQIHIMGKIQLEILSAEILRRFGISVSFGECKIMYRETIAHEVCGYGHFEPLRHYAEVHVRLTPLPRGSGIEFESSLSTDVLPRNYQNLIKTHVLEKQHRGALTGSPLTDVKITLTNGRAHEKHTDGGDFREATYRAIRQGIFSAKGVLLEPIYIYEITAPTAYGGRIIGELQQMCACQQPPQRTSDSIVLCGTVPVSCALDYPAVLAGETSGSAQINLRVSGYDICHNSEEVINKIAYQKERDLENSASSVFVSHGTAYTVAWDEAPEHMHLEKL